MPDNKSNAFTRYFLFLMLLLSANAWSLGAVTLQLKWQHQFQFAGYYAALHKGYYQAEGLEVIIREAQAFEDPVAYVLENNAQYGVGTSELLLLHNMLQPVVVLAVIFQHSPLVLIVPQSEEDKLAPETATLGALQNKPVMIEPNSAELLAFLATKGLMQKNLNLVEHSFDMNDLIQGKTAAISAYITDEPYILKQRAYPYKIHRPVSAGIDFYGDNLFTTTEELSKHPARVEAFRRASLKGWQYAMQHPEEMIDLIYEHYSTRHSKEHLRYEFEQMKNLLLPDLVHVGYMNEARWQHIGDTYAKLNMLPAEFTLDNFLYQPEAAKYDYLLKNWIAYLSLSVIFCLILAVVFVYFNALLRKKTKWLKTVLSNAPSALIIVDDRAKVLSWNQMAASIFGWQASEVLGRSLYEFLIPLPSQARTREVFHRVLDKESSPNEHLWCHTKSGKMILCDWRNAPLESDRIIAMVSDVTQQKEMEDRLSQMAHTDSLTGIANRSFFFQKLEEAITLAKRRKEKLALLFIDLDDFKIVNDQYGHEFGDVVLCEVVQRIRMAVREADMLARIGGDEFVLLLYDCQTEEKAMQVAEKVLFHLERPIQVSGLTVVVGGSIGISFYPDNASKTTDLVKSADRAMYSAKQTNKNGIRLASNSHLRH